MTDWPQRPARAGNNPVLWNDMSVTFLDHDEPTQAEDGDRWQRPDGEFIRRNGEWVRNEGVLTWDTYGEASS